MREGGRNMPLAVRSSAGLKGAVGEGYRQKNASYKLYHHSHQDIYTYTQYLLI